MNESLVLGANVVIAVFTMVLGVSTIGLWVVTGRAARAAELNAKAAIAAWLPIIRAEPAELLDVDGPISDKGPYVGVANNGIPQRFSAVGNIQFTNYGRGPAFPVMFEAGWLVARRLPATPNYRKAASANHAVVLNERGTYYPDLHCAIELANDEIERSNAEMPGYGSMADSYIRTRFL